MTASTASTDFGPRGEEISATGEWTPELEQWLRERAAEAGFDTAGVAPVDDIHSPADSDNGVAPSNSSAQLDAQRFAALLDYLGSRVTPYGCAAVHHGL